MPENRESVGNAQSLLHCYQLPDRNSRNISRDILEFCAVFKNVYVLIPQFPFEPLTTFWKTLIGKHCSTFLMNKLHIYNNPNTYISIQVCWCTHNLHTNAYTYYKYYFLN